MAYELVELSTGNLVGAYDTEQAALRDVAAAIRRYGRASVDSLALGLDDPQGDGRVIAEGSKLAALALTEVPAARPQATIPKRVTATPSQTLRASTSYRARPSTGQLPAAARGTRARSAVTGRFVPKSAAKSHPKTTVTEPVTPKKRTDGSPRRRAK